MGILAERHLNKPKPCIIEYEASRLSGHLPFCRLRGTDFAGGLGARGMGVRTEKEDFMAIRIKRHGNKSRETQVVEQRGFRGAWLGMAKVCYTFRDKYSKL